MLAFGGWGGNDMAHTPSILSEIVAHKRDELVARKRQRPLQALQYSIAAQPAARGFAQALRQRLSQGQPAVIAEIKKASPSKGVIRADFNPPAIAESYAAVGASCLSVLTDERFFQGQDEYLAEVRQAAPLPVLRKDFTLEPYQVYEARALGADCILLIAAILDAAQLKEYQALATDLGMDALVEVHNAAELEAALAASPSLIGINNRNLQDFTVDLATTLSLAPQVPASATLVAESGIHTPADIQRLQAGGINAFLIGEAFMQAKDPGAALRRLFF